MADQVAPATPAEAAPEGVPAGFSLDAIPEDARGDWYSGLESHLGELSSYKDTWSPYQDAGINEIAPESLQHLLSWVGRLDETDPDGTREAILELAESVGVSFDAPAPEAAAPAAPAADGAPTIESLAQQLAELTDHITGRETAEAQAQTDAEVKEAIASEWAEVKADYKKAYKKDLEGEELERVKALAKQFAYDNETPIRAAYEFIAGVSGAAQNALVADAPAQPAPAVPAGAASTTASPPETFDEAARVWAERNRQLRAV